MGKVHSAGLFNTPVHGYAGAQHDQAGHGLYRALPEGVQDKGRGDEHENSRDHGVAPYPVGSLSQRQAAGMPPYGHLLVLRTDCSDPRHGEEFLRTLRARAEPALPEAASLIGPLPSPLQRRAGKFRFQLISLAADRAAAQVSATVLVTTAESMRARRDLKWSIDIDPQDLF